MEQLPKKSQLSQLSRYFNGRDMIGFNPLYANLLKTTERRIMNDEMEPEGVSETLIQYQMACADTKIEKKVN
ncbi:MAG: hypothetical protein FWE45_00200 [Firmicutes bacterium]|nr:hypothetical protein [Bacillota bacterium]